MIFMLCVHEFDPIKNLHLMVRKVGIYSIFNGVVKGGVQDGRCRFLYYLVDYRFGCERCRYKFEEFTRTYIRDFNFSLEILAHLTYVHIHSRSICIQDQVLCSI